MNNRVLRPIDVVLPTAADISSALMELKNAKGEAYSVIDTTNTEAILAVDVHSLPLGIEVPVTDVGKVQTAYLGAFSQANGNSFHFANTYMCSIFFGVYFLCFNIERQRDYFLQRKRLRSHGHHCCPFTPSVDSSIDKS